MPIKAKRVKNKEKVSIPNQTRAISSLRKEIKGIKLAIRALDHQVAKLVDWAEEFEFDDGGGGRGVDIEEEGRW
jgi:hypothetical protein